MTLHVDAERLLADLASLAEIGRAADGGITRTAFSAEDAAAREWYLQRARDAGLVTRLDGLGSMVTGEPGRDDGPAVWTGSHLDTVPEGGAFDGALGAVAALECVRRIRELGLQLPRPVRAAVFSDEEGNYGHLLGSVGMRRNYTHDELAGLVGRDGDRLLDALARWPHAEGAPTATALPPGTVDAFVELHIEQGPHLEAAGIPIGVVTSIVGLSGAVVRFRGRTDHAGTTAMPERRDALRAAAAFLVTLPGIAAATGPSAVVTAGRVTVEPGAANQVPGLVSVLLDFRDPRRDHVVALGAALEAAARRAGAEHGVEVDWRSDDIVDPVPLADPVRTLIASAADRLELAHIEIASGAGHDAQNLARFAPTGMVFVPSRDGRSHSRDEYTAAEHVVAGADVLLATVVALASR